MRAAYRQKDVEFPVRVGMQNFMADKPQAGAQRYDRDGLYRWSAQRLGTVLAARKHGPEALADPAGFFAVAFKALDDEGWTEELVRTEPRSKLREKLTELAPKAMPAADIDEIDAKVSEAFTRRGWPRPRTRRNWPSGRGRNSG